ncbi:MAG: Selenate reductase subunit gamma [Syntrophomonadaceae bacterium]|nr:Selenate reductase subunit gamma [Bacillota bacterium]
MKKNQKSKIKNQVYKVSVLFSVFCVLLLPGAAHSREMVIMAKKLTQELPLDPNAAEWATAKAVDVPFASQVITRPRTYEASVKEARVRALHNGKDIAFLLEWTDSTRDAVFEVVHTFSDAAALQFPSERTGTMPHFGMGHEEGIVNIWNWKAVFQFQDGADKKVVYAMVDDFLAGHKAGNPVSLHKTPVENLIAGGFGSLTAMEEKAQNVAGGGKWDAGTWKVLFKRSIKGAEKYEAQFEEGKLTPLAFAVWDGAKGERGARKAVSTWYYVGLEKETPATVYIYPILAFIGTAAVLGGLILYLIRKRRAE